MMKRLDAAEMIPRVYTTVYSFINICEYNCGFCFFVFILLNHQMLIDTYVYHLTGKEPWQALLGKHLEAFSSGAKTGDLEYAVSAYYQHCNTAIYGCGVNLELLSQTIPAHAKWAFQFNQLPGWRMLVLLVSIFYCINRNTACNNSVNTQISAAVSKILSCCSLYSLFPSEPTCVGSHGH